MTEDGNDAALIRETYRLAEAAAANGDEPFGALLARDGEILLRAENTVTTDRDITAHAETNLVSQALKSLGPETVAACTLYTSTEPCVMCCGAIWWARIRRLVFGASVRELAALTGFAYDLSAREIFERLDTRVVIAGPVLEAEGMAVHRGYWT